MLSSSVSPNYQFVKNWLITNRDTNIQILTGADEYPNPFHPIVIDGFDKAIQAFANAIQEREKKPEKLFRLSDKLRNVAADSNNQSFKNTLALFNFCLSKGFSDIQLLQGCSLVNGVVEIKECALPISEKVLDFILLYNLSFRLEGTEEQFSAELFRNYIHFLPSKNDFQPKEQNWNHLTLNISDVSLYILNGFYQSFLKKSKREGLPASFLKTDALYQLSRLTKMTGCPVLNIWLENVRNLIEQNAFHPFLLKRFHEGKLVIGIEDFPIKADVLGLMKQLGLPVKVEGSEEVFAANVFGSLAEKFTGVQDFLPQNYFWAGKDISVSRALFSLAPFFESMQVMNSRSSYEDVSTFESLEGLLQSLAYLATRDPFVIKDVSNVYLFSQAFCITEVKNECARQLAILTSENPKTTWTLSHYLSSIPFEEDCFTSIMDRGFTLSAEDFPLNEELVSKIEKSNSAFIVFGNSELFFAKNAFLEIVNQANQAGQKLSLKDFLPHPDLAWLASIQTEQLGGIEIIDSKIFQKNQKALKALATYLRTRDIENLIELNERIDWYSFFNSFKKACETLANVLKCKCESFELGYAAKSLIQKEIVNWLLKETPGLPLAEKLQSVKKKVIDYFWGLRLRSDKLDCTLNRDSNGSWRISFEDFYFSRPHYDVYKLQGIPFRSVNSSENINDEELKILTSQSTTHLSLYNPAITLEGLRHIATLPLKELNISSSLMSEDWFEHIPKTVESLGLRRCKLTIIGLKKISHLPLKELILESCSLADADLIALKGMPLRELSLSFCKNIQGSGLRHLHSAWLNKADLNYTAVDDEGFANLAHMPLKDIRLASTSITDRTISLMAKMSLKSLHLTNTHISDVSVEQLLNKKLEHIYLDDTHVSEELKNRFSALGIKPYLDKKSLKVASSNKEKEIGQKDSIKEDNHLEVMGEKEIEKDIQRDEEQKQEKEIGQNDSKALAKEDKDLEVQGEKEIEKDIQPDEEERKQEEETAQNKLSFARRENGLEGEKETSPKGEEEDCFLIQERAESARLQPKEKVKPDNSSRISDRAFFMYSAAIAVTVLFVLTIKK